jgi:polyisoprenoid-binding protein YceI
MLDLEIPGYIVGEWEVDAAHSYVGFIIKHMMVSKVRGHFTVVGGRVTTEADPLKSTVSAFVDATSIDTGNLMRDEHVRSADFFDAENHPQFSFVSTAIEPDGDGFQLVGDLTIRGITKSVSFDMETPEFGPDAFGGTRAGFAATLQVNRTDFGVNYNGPIPGGGMALAEKVDIILDIQAVLAKPSEEA